MILFCKFRSFFANMKTYTNKNAIFTAKINHILTLNIENYGKQKKIEEANLLYSR